MIWVLKTRGGRAMKWLSGEGHDPPPRWTTCEFDPWKRRADSQEVRRVVCSEAVIPALGRPGLEDL